MRTSFFVTNHILAANSNCIVKLSCQNCSYSWLVDSGATICAVRHSHIQQFNLPIVEENISINGIGGSVLAIGYVYLNLLLGGTTVSHRFYVFDSLPCRANGILGQDFLDRFKGVLDFQNKCLILYPVQDDNVTLPFMYQRNSFTVEPRCESIHYLHTNITEECVICSKEIKDGVYLASSIAEPQNGLIPIKILNTTENVISIQKLEPVIYKLSDYEICQFDTSNQNADRVKRLFSQLKLSHLKMEEQITIENLCAKYSDIFYIEGDRLSTTNVYKQSITIKPNTEPVYTKPYRLPYSQKSEIETQIGKMLEQGIIEPCRSEWSSPILLVPKKTENGNNGKRWRLVIDYRKLNNCIENDRFPLPNITEILDSLSGSIYFTHLDLFQGYYNVELEEKSRKFTAFNAGQYQMTRMPMGLKTSPGAFSRMMNLAMSGLNFEKCLVFQDDLIIFGRNLNMHNENLQLVFERIRKVNLKLNPAKCEFLKKEVLYLGHVVSGNGILPDPNKIKIVENYPIPQNADELKRFIAFINYYRKFIPGFADIAFHLNKLCRKNVKFDWDEMCQNAFETLKKKIISPPVLQYPDFSDSNEFIIQTDASGYAIGAILSNKDSNPIAYASRSLNKAEKNYPTIEKELLAIVWACKYFRPYLYGRRFKIQTDHKPLVHLFGMKDPSSRLLKFRLQLEEYDFVVEYVRGSDNAAADALSRIIVTSEELKEVNEKINVMTRAQKRQLQSNDTDTGVDIVDTSDRDAQPKVVDTHIKPLGSVELRFIKTDDLQKLRHNKQIEKESRSLCYVPSRKIIYVKFPTSQSQITRAEFARELGEFSKEIDVDEIYLIKTKDNNVFVEKLLSEIKSNQKWTGPRICVLKDVIRIENKDDRKVILNDFHLLPTSGHAGVRRMINNIKKYYYWTGLDQDVRAFVQKCDKCQKQKHANKYVKEPMVITTTAHSAFEKIMLDIVGPLDKDYSNYSYILTLQCELTKYVEAYPLETKTAQEVARTFVNNFILRYGVPKTIATDRGAEFMCKTMNEVCKLLNINKINSTAYHHQSIGALENTHKHLGAFLRIQTDNHPEYWSTWLPFWSFAYNTSVHTGTKFTPYELVFGKKCSIPSNLCSSIIEPLYNHEDYPMELKYRLQVSQKEARANLLKDKMDRKISYDKNSNPIMYRPNDLILVKNETGNKLSSIYLGPYKVVQDASPNVEIIKNGKVELIHKNRTKLYYNE